MASDSELKQLLTDQHIDEDHMELSGSSMATAMVSGTVALMLERNEDLNPNLVKAILLMTASKLTRPHMMEQGNGMLNTLIAVELADEVQVQEQTVSKAVRPYWMLGSEMVWARRSLCLRRPDHL